jgi:RNA-directed DNA polymerase
MDRVADLISDGRVLDLIESFLQQDILAEAARWTPAAGSPQGAVISPPTILQNCPLSRTS